MRLLPSQHRRSQLKRTDHFPSLARSYRVNLHVLGTNEPNLTGLNTDDLTRRETDLLETIGKSLPDFAAALRFNLFDLNRH